MYRYIEDVVHEQPGVWELPGSDVSCWTWDQRHNREQHFCLLARYTAIEREGRSTSHYRQTSRFQFPFMCSCNIQYSSVYGVFISQLIWYAWACPHIDFLYWGQSDFPINLSNRETSRYAWTRYGRYWVFIKAELLWWIFGFYPTIWSSPFTYV